MEHIRLYEEGEYQYAGAFGFIPTLTMYLREDAAEALPLVLVVPGVPVPEAAAWPELADAFLRSCLG